MAKALKKSEISKYISRPVYLTKDLPLPNNIKHRSPEILSHASTHTYFKGSAYLTKLPIPAQAYSEMNVKSFKMTSYLGQKGRYVLKLHNKNIKYTFDSYPLLKSVLYEFCSIACNVNSRYRLMSKIWTHKLGHSWAAQLTGHFPIWNHIMLQSAQSSRSMWESTKQKWLKLRNTFKALTLEVQQSRSSLYDLPLCYFPNS